MTFSRKPSGFNQQGGVIAFEDEDNFVKLVYRSNPRFGRGGSSGVLDMIIEKNGYNFSLAGFRSPDVITDNNYSLILRLERKGGRITGAYSRDGKTFNNVGSADILLRDTKAGLIVCNGSDTGRPDMPGMQRMPTTQTPQPEQGDFEVSYDYFRITNSGLK